MRKTTKSSYVFFRDGTAYLVIIEDKKNNSIGNPKYKALITEIYCNFRKNNHDRWEADTYEVKFNGHCRSDGLEAECILDEFLKDFK